MDSVALACERRTTVAVAAAADEVGGSVAVEGTLDTESRSNSSRSGTGTVAVAADAVAADAVVAGAETVEARRDGDRQETAEGTMGEEERI